MTHLSKIVALVFAVALVGAAFSGTAAACTEDEFDRFLDDDGDTDGESQTTDDQTDGGDGTELTDEQFAAFGEHPLLAR